MFFFFFIFRYHEVASLPATEITKESFDKICATLCNSSAATLLLSNTDSELLKEMGRENPSNLLFV